MRLLVAAAMVGVALLAAVATAQYIAHPWAEIECNQCLPSAVFAPQVFGGFNHMAGPSWNTNMNFEKIPTGGITSDDVQDKSLIRTIQLILTGGPYVIDTFYLQQLPDAKFKDLTIAPADLEPSFTPFSTCRRIGETGKIGVDSIATCAAGETAIGGGCALQCASAGGQPQSYPLDGSGGSSGNPRSWVCGSGSCAGATQAFAICCAT